MKEVLGTGDIAKLCHATENTVKKWIDSGDLPGFRLPGRGFRRVLRDDFIEFCTRKKFPLTMLPEDHELATVHNRTMSESVANLKRFCDGNQCNTRTLRTDCLAVLTSYETLAIGQR